MKIMSLLSNSKQFLFLKDLFLSVHAFRCMHMRVKVSTCQQGEWDPLELEVLMSMSCHVGSENTSLVLHKSKPGLLIIEPPLQSSSKFLLSLALG